MKVYELSKELGMINKDVINFLKSNNYKVSSHNQNLTDEMIDLVRSNFQKNQPEEKVEKKEPVKQEKKFDSTYAPKKFGPEDIIVCRSVTPYKLNAIGADRLTVYRWNAYGDVDYVKYRDLQSWRTTQYIREPLILIEDEDLCYQWRRDLGDTYKYFIDVEYPEEFFDKTDKEFENLLRNAPQVIKDVIKITAIDMIKNENYPTIQKLNLIDDILGTCLKDFI